MVFDQLTDKSPFRLPLAVCRSSIDRASTVSLIVFYIYCVYTNIRRSRWFAINVRVYAAENNENEFVHCIRRSVKSKSARKISMLTN